MLITTLVLEPLVSENAQRDMGLSSSPTGRPNTTSGGHHTIIVVLSVLLAIKARSLLPLHTSAAVGRTKAGGRHHTYMRRHDT